MYFFIHKLNPLLIKTKTSVLDISKAFISHFVFSFILSMRDAMDASSVIFLLKGKLQSRLLIFNLKKISFGN